MTITTNHPVLHNTHYAIYQNGTLLNSLTADPALWLSCRGYKKAFCNKAVRAKFFQATSDGTRSYKEYKFVPCVHPATLASYEAGY